MMVTNPLLEELEACPTCGHPVFTFRYGTFDEIDRSEPASWMIVDCGPSVEPITAGIQAATVCTSCGRITDLQTDRAIIWNVRDSGSPVPMLVPAIERPWDAVYDAREWDENGACDLFHLACLRGRWADDIELEAVATGRLLDAERRLYEDVYTDELRERAEVLVRDGRLSWVSGIELHSELGRDASGRDAERAYQHLRTALDLAVDSDAAAAFRADNPAGAPGMPDVPWLAIDTADAANEAGREEEALDLLRWAIPACTESDIQARGASLGSVLAHQMGDGDLALTCELLVLNERCTWLSHDTALEDAWSRIQPLLVSDPTGTRLRRARAEIDNWVYSEEVRAELLSRLRQSPPPL